MRKLFLLSFIVFISLGLCLFHVGLVRALISYDSIGGGYYKGGNKIFYEIAPGQALQLEADFDSFEVINNNLARDINNVYHKTEIIADADPATYGVIGSQELIEDLGDNFFARDMNNLFYVDHTISHPCLDFTVFVPLGLGDVLGRDAEHTYKIRIDLETTLPILEVVEIADPQTYEVISEDQIYGYYSKDKIHVYHYDGYNLNVINGADPDSFEVLGNYYARDKNNLYYYGVVIPNSDPASFKALSGGHAKDKKYGYYSQVLGGEIRIILIPGIDYNSYNYYGTYSCISESCADQEYGGCPVGYEVTYDSNSRYCDGIKASELGTFFSYGSNIISKKISTTKYDDIAIAECTKDPETLEEIEYPYYRNKYFVYLNEEIIGGADPETFELIDANFAKDKDSIFCRNELMAGAQPGSFEIIVWPYSLDQNHVYYQCSVLERADPATFKYLGDGYTRDDHNVFFRQSTVVAADIATFRVLDNGYAKDKNYWYYFGKREMGRFVLNSWLYRKLRGSIILTVEQNGEAYYVSPIKEMIYFLGRPEGAFEVMRSQGIGITNVDLEKIPVGLSNLTGSDIDLDGLPDLFEDAIGTNKESQDTDGDGKNDRDELTQGLSPKAKDTELDLNNFFASQQAGKIFLQVENSGEAWYVYPGDNKRYFLGRPADAFQVMKNLGLGISNENFDSL